MVKLVIKFVSVPISFWLAYTFSQNNTILNW